MKKSLFGLLLFFAASFQLFAQTDEVYLFSYFMGNGEDGLHLAYSEDGLKWKALIDNKSVLAPTAGGDKLMRDPCIIKGGDGKFHMVWTVSWNEKGIGYASSEDLVNWSEQQFIPVMAHEEGARNTWAPEIFYDDKKDRYMIFWASTIKGLYPETQDTLESGYNHRMYYTTTKDFKKFSKTKLFYEPGFNVIDATIIPHDGEYVMFVKDETRTPPAKNIRITKSDKLTQGYPAAGEPITGDYWAEGPTPLMVGKRCILYFDKYREHQMGAVASTDMKNWKDISDQIHFPNGTRHGTAFKVTREEFKRLNKLLAEQ
ncbi:glycoside hydrolase family 43 protein [Echinicola jeungdonensis]|uniref:Glycoside hydrolase family 43 protein n=1 Tax=Echinicola jeungdonensis TaxID=709343 RepID=A0ABV5J1G4_9BACT|nr:glycoside hydrolase family 43 protein [Echinicola jeungdonensis]MDN3668499.1 glycoside hydrolase family 43 protein [Echinicola jeungdonensis]